MLKSMSTAHTLIAEAEPLLWPGRRAAAEVAVLYPRSAETWDEMGVPLPSAIADATETWPLSHTVDYFAEVYGLYDALTVQGNVPCDFVDEDGATEAAVLGKYKVIFVTEPNIPDATVTALLAWAAKGGTLVFVGNAATADPYNVPTPAAYKAAGVVAEPPARSLVPGNPNITANVTVVLNGSVSLPFPVRGPRGNITSTSGTVVARFDDDTPAVTKTGTVYYAAFWPGLSHALQPGARCNASQTTSSVLLDLLLESASVEQPAAIDRPCTETPILTSAEGAVVTVLDWYGFGLAGATLNVSLGFTPSRVSSAAHGTMSSKTAAGVTSVTLAPQNDTADFISFYK